MLRIIDQGILSREPGRGAYMPSITQLSDGALIACQHVGRELASADNDIEVLTTTDGGTDMAKPRKHPRRSAERRLGLSRAVHL